MKRTALAATAAAVALLLAGCTSSVTSETITVTPGASGTYSNGDATVVVEPLTAETPTASEGSDEAAFISEVREKLRRDNVIPNATDGQLVSAGEKACEAISNGENTITLSVIDGEKADASGFFPDSAVIISAARSTICD